MFKYFTIIFIFIVRLVISNILLITETFILLVYPDKTLQKGNRIIKKKNFYY